MLNNEVALVVGAAAAAAGTSFFSSSHKDRDEGGTFVVMALYCENAPAFDSTRLEQLYRILTELSESIGKIMIRTLEQLRTE